MFITEGQERKVKMNQLKVEYLSPGSLTPYENNARKHAPDDIEAIKKSILEDGFNDPIGIWGENNSIVEGHGRQIAALELGLETVPCIRLDHLTDKQRREYMIRHNRTAELSVWDFQTLEEECAALAIEGQNFEELNFDFDQGELFDFMANDPFTENQTEHDTFVMSFEFPMECKEQLEKYIKEHGKKEITEKIMEVL